MARVRFFCAVCGLVFVTIATGCALAPTASIDRALERVGWARSVIATDEFRLSWFSAAIPADTQRLHVYLGGDGRAFLSRHRVARDPTGDEHLAVRLAIADPAPSAFLARPCYYGGATTAPCEASLWTLERYGPRVIAAVVAALDEIVERYPHATLTLVGYSGGGVVALLAAREVEQVGRVITVAAPLDTAAWTRLHGYTELVAHSNPAEIEHWPDRLEQVHLVGADDEEVPATIAAAFHERAGVQPPQSVIVPFQGYDHHCCWLEEWPALLEALAGGEGAQPSRK